MKIKFVICTIVALFVLSGASVWEGAAAIAAGESLPPTGFYVATNSFPMNTVVDIVNLENGRSVRAVVTSRLESPGLLAVVSRETGSMLGLGVQSLGRVSMTQPAGPVAHSSFAENGAWQPPAPAPFAVAVTEEITPADLPSAELPLADEPSAELPPADLPLAELPPAELPLADALVADDAAEPLAAAEQPPSVVVVVEHPGQQIPGQQPGLQPSQQPSQQPAGQVAVEHWQELPEQPAATEAPVLPPPQPAITEAPALPTPPPQPAITEAPVQPTPPPQPPVVVWPQPSGEQPPVVVPEIPVQPLPPAAVAEATDDAAAPGGDELPDWFADLEHFDFRLRPAEMRPPPALPGHSINPDDIIPGITRDTVADAVADAAADAGADDDAHGMIAAPPPGEGFIAQAPVQQPAPAQQEVPFAPPAEPPPVVEVPDDGVQFPLLQRHLVSALESGRFYVQVGAFTSEERAENVIRSIGDEYPLAVFNAGSAANPLFRILLGPLSQGEGGAVMQRFRSIGFSDAFVRAAP